MAETDRNQKLLDLIRQLRALYHLLYQARPRQVESRPQDPSLTRSQVALLCAAAEHAEGVTVARLAQQLHITSGAVTQLAQPLIKKKLLERRKNPHDGRSALLSVTDEPAAQNGVSFEEFYAQHVSPLFRQLSDAEVEQLTQLIKRIGA